MHLKMMTSMGGPDLSIANGDEIPFDDSFPFSAAEIHRFRAAEIAELGGAADEISAWLEANPYDEAADAPVVDDAAAGDDVETPAEDGSGDDEAAAADTATTETAPAAEQAAAPAPKPAAAKAAAKKG